MTDQPSMAQRILNMLPGYAGERERFTRRVNEGGPNKADIVEALMLAANGVGAGPRPGVFGTAARLEAVPQRSPAVTGGGSRDHSPPVPDSSFEMVGRPGVEDMTQLRARYGESPQREGRAFANDNDIGTVRAAQTKGEIQRQVPGGGVSLDQVTQMLQRLNIPVDRVHTAGTGTRYVHIKDPAGGPDVVIRVSADDHMGHPDRARAAGTGNFFETAGAKEPPGKLRYRGGTVINEGGERFGGPEALEAALKWRFPNQVAAAGESFLVRPDQAPRGTLFRSLPKEPPAPEAPSPSPDQPRLLSVLGAPVAGVPIWAGVPETAGQSVELDPGAGRFAQPQIANPNTQLIDDTSALTRLIASAADATEQELPMANESTPEAASLGKAGLKWVGGSPLAEALGGEYEPVTERTLAFDDRLLPAWMYRDYYTGSNARRPGERERPSKGSTQTIDRLLGPATDQTEQEAQPPKRWGPPDNRLLLALMAQQGRQ